MQKLHMRVCGVNAHLGDLHSPSRVKHTVIRFAHATGLVLIGWC